jgi:hypothetical protein
MIRLFSIILTFLAVLTPTAVLIVLQVYLSKMNQKWIGFVLPILTGIIGSIFLYLSIHSGLSNTLFRIVLFSFIFYVPTVLLLFINVKIVNDQKLNRGKQAYVLKNN